MKQCNSNNSNFLTNSDCRCQTILHFSTRIIPDALHRNFTYFNWHPYFLMACILMTNPLQTLAPVLARHKLTRAARTLFKYIFKKFTTNRVPAPSTPKTPLPTARMSRFAAATHPAFRPQSSVPRE
jgi:hypothetical protein